MLLEKIKDYPFENMKKIETDESSQSHDHCHREKSPFTIDELQMSTSAIALQDKNISADQKTTSEFENLSEGNIKLSETIEFLETEARIHRETLEMESKERMEKLQ